MRFVAVVAAALALAGCSMSTDGEEGGSAVPAYDVTARPRRQELRPE